MKFSTLFRVPIVIVFLFLTPDRLPAPVTEIETPTPAPKQSESPKAKREAKSTNTSKDLAKREISSRPGKPEKTATNSLFDGRWVGAFIGVPGKGNMDYILTIVGAGTIVTERAPWYGPSSTHRATCDGKTIRWNDGTSEWTVTLNKDGRTASVDYGAGSYHSSVLFHKASP